MFRWHACLLFAGVMLAGCGDDSRPPPPPPPTDSGRDTATMDSGMDGGDADASGDASMDAPSDAGDGGIPTVPVFCEPGTPPGTCETDGDCMAGEVCVEGGCPIGMGYCTLAGIPCGSARDCPGGTCTPHPSGGSVCVADDPSTCTTSATCASGFRCEGGTCVDRRLPCDPPSGCPLGYVCIRPAGSATYICVDQLQVCETDDQCFPGMHCIDPGGGERLCYPMGDCVSNDECSRVELTCGASPATGEATCNKTGMCITSTDCAKDANCEDVHETGLPQCLPIGTCLRDSDCPPRSLCFDGPGPFEDGGIAEGDGRAECVQRRAAL